MVDINRSGFCERCPVPKNLADYRNGRPDGGYFSDELVREAACKLIEQLALTNECIKGPEAEEPGRHDNEDETVTFCNHPASGSMSVIGDALDKGGDAADVIFRIESNRGDNE